MFSIYINSFLPSFHCLKHPENVRNKSFQKNSEKILQVLVFKMKRRGGGQAMPCPGVGSTWPSTLSSLSLSFLSPDHTHHHCSNSCSCYSCSRFFDLLAQPIFAAEIWINCSPVCDSSDYPNRILFSCLYL